MSMRTSGQDREGGAPSSLAEVEAKVAALLSARAHIDAPGTLDAIETHMSWVIRTDRHVYKMKKPVRTEYLDFSTLALRKARCEDEVRLNRRLASDVYLGVVPLVRDEGGVLRVGGSGEPVEWLVKMRRLPACRMLDRQIATGNVDPDAFARAATKLACFYAGVPRLPLDSAAYFAALQRLAEGAARVLADPALGLDVCVVAPILDAQRATLEQRREMLYARAAHGHIVDGHGDLRPEHVCLEAEPVFIDCLEFDAALRAVDPVDELGFLGMECERLGAPHLGPTLFDAYRRITGDDWPPEIVHLYQGLRASVRAGLAIVHLREERFMAEAGKWRKRAADYLGLARQHLRAIG